MSILGLDFETSSLVGIDCGAYRYADDPSTVILVMAVRKDDGPTLVWRYDDPDSEESQAAIALFKQAVEEGWMIRAFNAQFEVAICRSVVTRQLGIPEPRTDRWRCTMALCNRAAIQSNLAGAAEDLHLADQKDKRGKALIGIFSDRTKTKTLRPPEGLKIDGKKPKPRKTLSPILEEEILWDWKVTVAGDEMTVRHAWESFVEYCRKDVVVESGVARCLYKFELEGDELASFLFDLRMNYKGVPVNVAALEHTQGLVEEYSSKAIAEFQAICGLAPSQGKKLLPWLNARGYKGENLQADTVEKALEDTSGMTPEGAKILKMRSLLSFAALAKIPSMLRSVCEDGYVRGTTLWHGARTGRATGRIIQPQNMKKATAKHTLLAYLWGLCEGEPLSFFEELWESPLELFASCIRHFIQPHEGDLLDLDYVGVEARIGPWLCGQMDKLDSILKGQCQYKVMASEVAFGVPYEQVTKAQREVGKVLELQCIYGTGGRGMRDSLGTKGVDKTLKECNGFVTKFRTRFDRYPACWKEMESAAKAAILRGDVTQVAEGKLGFGLRKRAGIDYLVMRLPSGRCMYYPHPEIKNVFKKYDKEDLAEMSKDDPRRERGGYWIDQISFYGRQPITGKWGRIHTWGSRLFENACQAIGADLLHHGCVVAEEEGFDIRMLIHDQVLALNDGRFEDFRDAMCHKQPWAESFPLAASLDIVPVYLKEQ